MAATTSSIFFIPFLTQSPKCRRPSPPLLHLRNKSPLLPPRKLPTIRSQCSPCPPPATSAGVSAPPPPPLHHGREDTKESNPFAEALALVLDILKALKKPAITAVLLGFLLSVDRFGALAASGGRMGGSAFSSSSRSSSSSSSSSWSYSAPAKSSFSYSASYYEPTPFEGRRFYVGPAVRVGFGFVMGFAAAILLSAFLSDRSDGASVVTASQKTSVIKLQVGLLGLARSFQKELDRIAEAADTSKSEGLSYILTETTLSLLRHPDCFISAYSSVDAKRSIEDGEKRFNELSIEERGKFDEETLVNVNNIKRQKTTNLAFKGFCNEYIVVTILVAAEDVHKLPVINNSGDLKEALQKLASIPSSRILAVEVLWTPQNENDALSERELLEEYPLLRPL